jgi:hypothetical protein
MSLWTFIVIAATTSKHFGFILQLEKLFLKIEFFVSVSISIHMHTIGIRIDTNRIIFNFLYHIIIVCQIISLANINIIIISIACLIINSITVNCFTNIIQISINRL